MVAKQGRAGRALAGGAAALALAALAACGADRAPGEADAGAERTATAASPAPTPPAGIPVAGPERRILAFGDSLFAGYEIGPENSYPAQLETALRQRGINARITNAAVSGETSGAGAGRFAFVLDAQEPAPDLILLELGGNDLLRGLPPAQTRANFETMLGEARRRGIPVVLMGMRAPPNLGADYVRDFDGLYTDLARGSGVTLVPFWLESIYRRPELFLPDRVHPTREGVAVLVDNTAGAIASAVAALD